MGESDAQPSASERRAPPPAATAAPPPPPPPPPPQFAQPKLKPKVPAIGPLLPPTALPSGAVRLSLDASRAEAEEDAATLALASERGGSSAESRRGADEEADQRSASSMRASDGVFGGGAGADSQLLQQQQAKQRQQQGNDAVAQYQVRFSLKTVTACLEMAEIASCFARLFQYIFSRASQALSQNTSRVSAGAMSGGLVVRAKSKQPAAGSSDAGADDGKRRKVGGASDGAPSAAAAHSYGDDADATWVPPTGQRGDGRTAANAKFGY
jgi:hypothetical protein